jgi:pimeloyl-ACP methyl ester carboxylesterase
MTEVRNDGVRISYDVVGQGRPLMLLHGWCCDRSWWTEPGYVDELRSDHRLVNVDIRGHGASDKPHEAAAYTSGALTGDVFAIADAEGLDRFAIWGQSYGGWMAWMTAAAAPERVPAIVVSGAWDPRPEPEPTEPSEWDKALMQGGTTALVERFKIEDEDAFDREFPPWARAVTLRADPDALLAAHAPERWTDGIPNEDLGSFPVPALLIAGELEDEDDDAANVAALIPNGQSLRLPGLGHGGACAASALTNPHRPRVPRPLIRAMIRTRLSSRAKRTDSRSRSITRQAEPDDRVVGPRGLEPRTCGLRVRCSAKLS